MSSLRMRTHLCSSGASSISSRRRRLSSSCTCGRRARGGCAGASPPARRAAPRARRCVSSRGPRRGRVDQSKPVRGKAEQKSADSSDSSRATCSRSCRRTAASSTSMPGDGDRYVVRGQLCHANLLLPLTAAAIVAPSTAAGDGVGGDPERLLDAHGGHSLDAARPRAAPRSLVRRSARSPRSWRRTARPAPAPRPRSRSARCPRARRHRPGARLRRPSAAPAGPRRRPRRTPARARPSRPSPAAARRPRGRGSRSRRRACARARSPRPACGRRSGSIPTWRKKTR